MSVFAPTKQYQPKVHYTQYIRTENESHGNDTNPAEPAAPTAPEAK